jgi:hypothetical protein
MRRKTKHKHQTLGAWRGFGAFGGCAEVISSAWIYFLSVEVEEA